jgi:hypothetical protein
MLHYPKIPGSGSLPSGRCIAFEKVDGTNVHWEWDRDFGWHSFGTRRDAFNLTPEGMAEFDRRHTQLREAVDVFQATLAEGLDQVFRLHPDYQSFPALKAFTEFVGPNSFAGLHKTQDPKRLILFDLEAEDRGMIGPKQFVTDFGHLSIPRVVYEGRLTGKFVHDVRTGKYRVEEGVVCKGDVGGDDFWMVKIKTLSYMEKLKLALGNRWEDYWE